MLHIAQAGYEAGGGIPLCTIPHLSAPGADSETVEQEAKVFRFSVLMTSDPSERAEEGALDPSHKSQEILPANRLDSFLHRCQPRRLGRNVGLQVGLGRWSLQERYLHINLLELRVTAVAYINHQGGTRSRV